MFVPVPAVSIGVLAGMVSHYILDAATKNGIKLLYPSKVTVRFPFTTRTGGAAEYLVLTALPVIVVYFSYDVLNYYL